jgi:heat shock 70kDa protein 4
VQHREHSPVVHIFGFPQSPIDRSLVSFGPKQRALGEPAKTQEISNFRNTAGSLKRLLGRTVNDVEIQQVEKKFTHVNLVDVDGSVGVQVSIVRR